MPGNLGQKLIRAARRLPFAVCLLWGILILAHFPYDTDRTRPRPEAEASAAPVQKIALASPTPDYEPLFEKFHEAAKREAREFVQSQGLEHRRVLEIGAGRGDLQDIVSDYTGLDIEASKRVYFHKPFVAASATQMPFADNEFDAAWSFYVFEHVINPEQGLRELRRVVKDGGAVFLLPAWNSAAWAANGYEVRPWSHFGLGGRLVKASLAVRKQPLFEAAHRYPIRLLRLLSTKVGHSPTRLLYRELEANYSQYWVPDSDAANSIDRFETLLWFRSRGDECLNCSQADDFWNTDKPLILRIRKASRS